MKIVHAILWCVLFIFAGNVATQDGGTAQIRGEPFIAKGDLTLRDSPPNPWFYTKGDKIGVINTGDIVFATEQKVVGTLYGKFLWFKVEKVDPKTGSAVASGWAYAGDAATPSFFVKPSHDFKKQRLPRLMDENGTPGRKPQSGDGIPRTGDGK